MWAVRNLLAACGALACVLAACGGSDHSDLFSAQGAGGASPGSTGSPADGGRGVTSDTTGGTTTSDSTVDTTVATTAGTGGESPGTGGSPMGTSGTGGASAGTGGSTGTGTGGSGGGTSGAGAPCASSDTCRPALYCKKTTCGALDVLGKCTARPNNCDSSENPVCGCDGFTYLNTCLAEKNGQSIAGKGQCVASAVKCVPGADTCKVRPNGFCGVLVTDQSACAPGAAPTGKCWVVPENCQAFNDHFDSCDGMQECVHTCDAVKNEIPFLLLPDGRCQ
jgi:hypothetical protein